MFNVMQIRPFIVKCVNIYQNATIIHIYNENVLSIQREQRQPPWTFES